MATGTINITFKRRQSLEAMYDTYCGLVALLPEPANDFDELLRLHIVKLWGYIGNILGKGKERNTLSLDDTDAFAFHVIWKKGSAATPLAGQAVQAVIAAIDQYRKSPTRLITEIL